MPETILPITQPRHVMYPDTFTVCSTAVFSAFNVQRAFTAMPLNLSPPPNYLNSEAPGTTPRNIQISNNHEPHTYIHTHITYIHTYIT
jgi:hypothetical protein